MRKPYNVLVTGAGAVIGYGIIKSLRESGLPVRIIGADIYPENYGRYICDAFEQAPYTSATGYYDWLRETVTKYQIDLVFPGIEQDLFSYNENRSLLSTRVVLNNERMIQLARDKYETYLFLRQLNKVPVITTLIHVDFDRASEQLGLPFIVKPRQSYASKGFSVIRSRADFEALDIRMNEGLLFQSYIGTEDDEYTFSVFGTGDGGYADHLILRRYLSQEGATQKAFVVPEDKELQEFVTILVSELKPIGPTNFQFRKSGGVPYLLEINPRISSACSLRTAFGYNEPKHCMEYFLEQKTPVPEPKKNGKAIRHIADLIIYE